MLAVGFVLLSAVLGAAQGQPPSSPSQRDARPPQTDQTYDVTKGARLNVDSFAGEVLVRSWNRDAVRVQARHPRGSKVNIQSAPTGLVVRSDAHRGSVDYEITAPSWMPMRITGTYIFVDIEGIQSEVYAETTRGDIVVRGGSGAVTAKSIQGDVIVEGASGRINASSVNEDVRLRSVSGDITAETSNGNITLADAKSQNVEIATINGDITVDGAPEARSRYRLTTHNGDILVTLPDSAGVTFIIRTYNGSFASAIPLKGPSRSEARRGRRNTYVLGNGSTEMEIESFGGDIRVRRPGSTDAKQKEKR